MGADRSTKSGSSAAALDAAIAASARDPSLLRAAEALLDNDLPTAETILRRHLYDRPTDVAAIRMMAELAGRIGRNADAEKLLRRALDLAPGFAAARANLATALYRQNRPLEALAELDALVDGDVDIGGHQNLRAAALGRLGSYEEAIAIYEQVLARMPRQPRIWMSYGHVLKTVGRGEDGIAAYRRAIDLAPDLGEAWWSLANLKTVKLTDADVEAMEKALARPNLGRADLYHLHFALGKALDDAGEADRAFGHYLEGNRLRRQGLSYDAGETSRHVDRSRALFTPSFFAERQGWGCTAADPIFILGMPRAGSTLIEQILASHSRVEGTTELPDIALIARSLRKGGGGADYVDGLATLDGEALRTLGESYLETTRVQRRTGRPFFIDKMPNNWVHVGLIHLILPNARIVDARRHPLDCCFSNFRQHYARGQAFSYSLDDMGRYYADYVALMDHFDQVLPGRVHRVIHEHLLDDPEGEIRRLLAWLRLDFEPACLAFHKTRRAVRTASSEQVRRPLNRDGVDQWRAYDAWLDPLKSALGPVLDSYPEAPPRA